MFLWFEDLRWLVVLCFRNICGRSNLAFPRYTHALRIPFDAQERHKHRQMPTTRTWKQSAAGPPATMDTPSATSRVAPSRN